MKKRMIYTAIASLLFSLVVRAGSGKEGKITGVISGAHCGVEGMVCAPSHDLRRAELPGVYTKDNNFYVLVNVPQSFLAQWPVQDVTVEGTIYEKEKGIFAKKMSVKDEDKWRAVFEDGNIIDDMGHKEKLTTAMEIDGKWYCANCAATHKKESK